MEIKNYTNATEVKEIEKLVKKHIKVMSKAHPGYDAFLIGAQISLACQHYEEKYNVVLDINVDGSTYSIKETAK